MKLLCLSTDPAIAGSVNAESAAQGWSALVVGTHTEILESLRSFDPDMILAQVDGVEELEWWQQNGVSDLKPLLFINSQLTEDYVVRAFECGADGLVPKPLFSRRFLAARVNCYLRRQGLADTRRIVPRLGLVLDSQRYRVEVKGRGLTLTLTEYKILRALSTDQEVIVARREIQNQVFGDQQISKRSLDVHICALRKKLRPFDLDISSVRGVGYGLNPCAS